MKLNMNSKRLLNTILRSSKMEVQTELKEGVIKRGKKYKDLCFALDMPYSSLNRILNGFDRPPFNFKNRVHEVFEVWDSEGNTNNVKK